MNIKDTVVYYAGYVKGDEFWCEFETNDYRKAQEFMKSSNTQQERAIFEKTTFFRRIKITSAEDLRNM